MTLLIIDDEPIIRRGLGKMVAKATPYFKDILQAENAKEALAVIETQSPKVVFADINLPDMNGLDLVAIIKERCPETLIVMISGYDDFTYARHAIHLGVFDYLLKPIAQSDIHQLITRLIDQLEQNNVTTLDKVYSQNDLCNRAAYYLSQHYAKKDLSLSMVATALFVDPSYLSKQMKQHLGKSFNDYLMSLRIEKAKELLNLSNSHYTVQEIGEKSGYPNQHYFSRVFKQYTGLSPSHFRQH